MMSKTVYVLLQKINLNRVRARGISTQISAALCNKSKGGITHTGQIYDEKDYRNVRFTNAARLVNENWGINLVAEQPVVECKTRVVWCDGGDEQLGHPKVYINLDQPGNHTCGYCGQRFKKIDDHGHGH